jgi:hypothetical protein
VVLEPQEEQERWYNREMKELGQAVSFLGSIAQAKL